MTLVSKIQNILDETNKKIQDLINSKNYSPKEADKIVQDATLEIRGITVSNITGSEIDPELSIGRPHINFPPIHVDPIPVPKLEDIIPRIQIPTREELEEQARKLAKDLADATKAKLVETAQNAINDLRNQIPDPTEQARQMIAEIESYKEQLNSLLEQMNPVALINKALDKAEQISEAYIDSKMVEVFQSFETLHLKAKSNVDFSLDGTKINGSVSLYLVFEDFNGDFTQQYLKSLTTTVEIDLSNLQDIHLPEPVPHDGNINIEKEIMNNINARKTEIILGLTEAVTDSYLPIFTVINKFKEIMKI
ncbi:hypothetical protein ACQYAC_19235 [Bacillus sp. MM09(2025)]|uniref:hypothetical protein n=1 Tax=Bacillus sp. MM09(2025) TaxID=3422493 RepID=UPI003D2C1EA4